MKFIIDKKYIEQKLVDEKEHPELPLLIYNYTPVCQFSRSWDEITMQCRGLIVHKDTEEIIARPFKKFFNYEEHLEKNDELPNEIPEVYAKLDGSLGILYFWDGVPYVATRGSFTSDQALWATEYLRKSNLWQRLDQNYTHLFEIIYPENRIVVNYDFSGLVHLASIHIETGKSIAPNSDFSLVGTVPFSSYQDLKALNVKNEEGFVLHYPSADFRVKIKFEDYVKLHKVITGLSQIGIWEMLRDGIDPTTQDIPDEMYDWLDGVVTDLKTKFQVIESSAKETVKEAKNLETRKDQAIFIQSKPYSGVAFSVLDGKEYNSVIWKMIRPKGALSFRKDIDA